MIINDQDDDIIEERLEQLRLAAYQHITIAKEVEHRFTVSIGSTIMKKDESLKYLLKEADQALHQAIDNGGNETVVSGFIELG